MFCVWERVSYFASYVYEKCTESKLLFLDWEGPGYVMRLCTVDFIVGSRPYSELIFK